MKEGRLQGKVAIITGSTSGIGEAIARLFAHEGAKVIISGRRAEKGEQIRDEICQKGSDAIFVKTDMTKDEDVKAMIQTTLDNYGRIDILVNNAGNFLEKPFKEITSDDWDHFITLDGRSYFICMQLVLQHMGMQKAGSIINITSLFATKPVPSFSLYSFIKAGITQLSRVVALEYADKGIRVNTLIPGATTTEMVAGNPGNEQIVKQIPMGRFSTSQEQAYAALYLASDESSYVTGTTLIVDGGWYPAW